ncbi:MAG: sigma-70 family RNA polymerase sigma factor [Ardenticatenaceae bacterium]|nr:sigma-70 family RNA polymerase sigma factor [Anaerolineales bacterium]MCB8923404.1 sigma-70 family RNA polymerase sigma factor [Ardenticatenaceae bacterium]
MTAFAELCEQALPHLISFLRRQFSNADPHLLESAAVDCLLNYQSKPTQYDPDQLALFPFLRMAARGDLLNALDSQRREERRLVNIDDDYVQQRLPADDGITAVAEFDEWLQQHTDVPRKEILRALYAKLDQTDRQILRLILEGVRETSQFALVMGLENEEAQTQREAVKRAKDRIKKQLRRFGKQL